MVYPINRELMKAVVKNDLDAASELLMHGADPNSNLFLHYAKGSEMIRLLLDSGSLVNATNKYGDTALHVAVSCGKSYSVLMELMKEKPTINARNWKGNSPLHLAVRKNDIDLVVVRELLENGADINMRNYERRANSSVHSSPLDYAVGNEACAKLLIKISLIKNLEQGYENIVDLTASQKHGTYNTLSSYISVCVNEIERMKTEFLKEDLSVFRYMIPRYLMCTRPEEWAGIYDAVFKTLEEGNYSIYGDMILSQLKKMNLPKALLLNGLRHMQLYTYAGTPESIEKRKKVVIDIYSTRTIMGYLDKDDIINVIIAFYQGSKG